MRDWQTYVRENLGSSRLDHPQIDEISCELANHLEETYQTLRSNGLSAKQADEQ
jgi:hypothetical protein